VLLAEDASPEAAIAIAERIASACALPVDLNGLAVATSASIGITLAPTHGGDVETLLRRADIAMYVAKRAGKPWSVFDSEDVSIERLTVSADIGQAIEQEQFELWFQPKVEIGSGRIVGAEGLIRWRHPERGLLLPESFLELVRLSGHNDSLTDQALRMGISHARRCIEADFPIDVAVNVWARSLHEEALPTMLEDLLDEFGVPPSQLLLEITETEIMDDIGLISPVMQRVADLGVGVSIDDFGTGHSSLVRIRKLPVTELKIDRSFIAPLLQGQDDAVIVQSIIDLASKLGLRTVAEGVEDSGVAQRLAEFGCDMAQGFLWSPALSPESFMELLKNDAIIESPSRALPAPEGLS
jgi:EAL domain-containing protein (putative c-di-GMP-specific phosphodiesterase class I)